MRVCVTHEFEKATQRMSAMEAARLLLPFAHALDCMLDDSSLDYLLQYMASRLQKTDRADLEMILVVRALTVRVSMRQGKYTGAVEVLQEVDDSRAQALAEDHPKRLCSQRELAKAYTVTGQIDKAIELLRRITEVEEKLAEDHPHKLASQHALAESYRANGQIDKAVKLREHVVKAEEKLAEDNANKLASQHELARAYRADGQIDKAIKLLEYVVKVSEKLAEDHPNKLASQRALAYYKTLIIEQRP